jgi:ABC-type transporter Mla MlaB component
MDRRCNPSAAFGLIGDLSQETLHGVWNPRESLSMMKKKKQATESAAVREIQGLEPVGPET